MCGNEQALTTREANDSTGELWREKKGNFFAGEYRVPCLEEAYQDDSMRGAAYFGGDGTVYR